MRVLLNIACAHFDSFFYCVFKMVKLLFIYGLCGTLLNKRLHSLDETWRTDKTLNAFYARIVGMIVLCVLLLLRILFIVKSILDVVFFGIWFSISFGNKHSHIYLAAINWIISFRLVFALIKNLQYPRVLINVWSVPQKTT